MNNKIAIVGSTGNSICFDFYKKIVYLFRKGWASKTLKLVDIAIPFDKITAIELEKPTMSGGRIALIVEGNRLLAEDQFDNNASELSIGTKMYPTLKEAVDALIAAYPNIQLSEGTIDAPKTKNQQNYATKVTYDEFVKNGEKPKIVKSGNVSPTALLVISAVIVVCVILICKFLL